MSSDSKNLPDTPIKFVDTQAETIAICNQWRDAAAAKRKAYEEALAKTNAAEEEKKLPYGFLPQSSFSKAITDGGRLLLGIDLEGRDLGHDGTIDILAICDVDANITYLFDTCVMQEKAFTTGGDSNAWSLKELIEIGGGRDGSIVFLVYDVRMDAAALFHLYGVRLGGKPSPSASASTNSSPVVSFGGVYDLQIAKCLLVQPSLTTKRKSTSSSSHHHANGHHHKKEGNSHSSSQSLSSSSSNRQYLIGLATALTAFFSNEDRIATEKGRAVFVPEKGGDYAEWVHRPLNSDLMTYCAVTIRYYGALFQQVGHVKFGKSIETIMHMTEQRLAPQVEDKVPKQRNGFRDF